MSDVDRRGPVDPRLLRLVPALRVHLTIVAAIAAVTALAVVLQAEALARALTDLVADGALSDGLAAPVVVLVSIALVRALAMAATEWSSARAMRALRRDVRSAVLDHATLDGDRSTGGLASREATIVTAGVDQLEPYVRQFLPALMLAVAVPLLAGARILFADLLSAVLIALTVPLIPVFMVLIGRMTERRTARQWAVLQRLGGHFLDVIEGLPTLRLFGRAEAQRDSVHEVSEQYRATTMGALRIAFLSALALELIATLSVALIAVEIGLRLAGGSLGLQTALVVLLLTPECYLPLRRVGASFHAAQSGLDASDDLHRLLARPTLPIGNAPAPASGALVLRDVSLRRGDRVVLDDLDLTVAPGELVVVTGPSGVGKSTLIDACRGRLAHRSGSITVGGVEVATLDPASWADQLTVINQRLVPAAAAVIDEVRSATDASDAMVLDALADVGLTAIVGRRADELSGGQLRRVQIARALVAVRTGAARFVVADEPTAHLDADAADLVWTALAGLAHEHGAGVLVASHDPRSSTVADRVLALGHVEPAAPSRPGDHLRHLHDTITLAHPSGADHPGARRGAGPGDGVGNDASPSASSAIRRVLTMARPARRRFVGSALLGTAAEVCTIGLAGTAAWLIVRASERPDLAALSVAILGVRAFGTGKGVFRYAERLATHDTGLRALSEIRAAVVARLAEIAPAGVPGWQRGDLLQRIVADVDRLLDLFVRVLGPTVAVAATALGSLAITAVIDVPVALVLSVSLVTVGVLLPVCTVRRETSIGPALAAARATHGGGVLAATEGLDQLWANRMLGRARLDLDHHAERIDRLEQRRTHVRMVGSAIVAAAPLLTATACLATIAATSASLSGPAIGVLVLWPLAILELVGTVNESAATVPSITASAQRVLAVLDTPDPNIEPAHPRPIAARPPVALDDVAARWPNGETEALSDVSMHLEPGQFVAVTGPSGSGKSTLAAVLVGFLAPAAGTYRLGDVPVDEARGDAVRRRVTWIQQVPWIADSTVRENLRLADPAATDDDLRDALSAVALDEWLHRLAAGLDSQLGRGGSRMSGGEAQRLALARVLLAGHDVVVLDEPTANLDADTAASVLDTVLERCAGRSTVLLGHQD